MNIVPQKTCTSCGVVKPLSEYYRQKKNRDGLTGTCKICSRDPDRPRLNPGLPARSLEQRFFENVVMSNDPDACWGWNGGTTHGYATMWHGHHVYVRAHRWSYEHFVGPVPDGLDILHSCDNPPCTNPRHLSPGTHAENMADMGRKGRYGKVPFELRPRGESHGGSKLTADAVREIRRLRASGVYFNDIAEQFGVTRGCVILVVQRKRWKHVT